MTSSLQKTPFLKQGGAESGALFGDDERLRLLLKAWAELPGSVKTAVLEMVPLGIFRYALFHAFSNPFHDPAGPCAG